MNGNKSRIIRILSAAALSAVPVLAAEESGGGKSGTIILQWVNFAMLAAILGWLVAKHGGPLIAARSKQIQDGLRTGEKAKAEAEARAAEVAIRVANLGKEIETMRASARDEREREADRIRRESQAEIARIGHQAEMEIETAGKQARLEVQRFAARLAIDLAEQKVRARISPEIQSMLLDGFLRDLPDGTGRNKR
jgi:F-type H+-transporting ATPase subunit b